MLISVSLPSTPEHGPGELTLLLIERPVPTVHHAIPPAVPVGLAAVSAWLGLTFQPIPVPVDDLLGHEVDKLVRGCDW